MNRRWIDMNDYEHSYTCHANKSNFIKLIIFCFIDERTRAIWKSIARKRVCKTFRLPFVLIANVFNFQHQFNFVVWPKCWNLLFVFNITWRWIWCGVNNSIYPICDVIKFDNVYIKRHPTILHRQENLCELKSNIKLFLKSDKLDFAVLFPVTLNWVPWYHPPWNRIQYFIDTIQDIKYR